MIQVECPHCATAFKLNPDKLSGAARVKLRCQVCQQAFSLDNPNQSPKPRHAKVISFCNQKGGVAKTTSCLNLGDALKTQGYRVLLIDFDPQANLSQLLACVGQTSFADLASESDGRALAKLILKIEEDLWLLPSNAKMSLLPKRRLHQADYQYMLSQCLAPIKRLFDFILIDTPPSIDFFTLNALLASDHCILPTQAEFLSLQGIQQTLAMLNSINQRHDKSLGSHLLLTQYDHQQASSLVIATHLQQHYADQLLQTVISQDERLPASQIARQTLQTFAPDSVSAGQYQTLAKELLARL